MLLELAPKLLVGNAFLVALMSSFGDWAGRGGQTNPASSRLESLDLRCYFMAHDLNDIFYYILRPLLSL